MTIPRLVLILLPVAMPALAEPMNDPWALVPALPAACYQNGDDFPDKVHAASAALEQEVARQTEINDAISRQFQDIDPMEQQQRMVEFMMSNPQEAQRIMETVQQSAMQTQQQMPDTTQMSAQLDGELRELEAAYEAALQQDIGPIEQRRQALISSPQWCTPASLVEVVEINKQQNRAYDTLCASWWKAGGAFHAWFEKFRQYQIDWTAEQDKLAEATRVNYRMMGIPADNYRGTYSLSAPIEYLRRANLVFFKRAHSPISEEAIEECRDGHG